MKLNVERIMAEIDDEIESRDLEKDIVEMTTKIGKYSIKNIVHFNTGIKERAEEQTSPGYIFCHFIYMKFQRFVTRTNQENEKKQKSIGTDLLESEIPRDEILTLIGFLASSVAMKNKHPNSRLMFDETLVTFIFIRLR